MSNLYLIGNSHLDPVWLWRWQEGFSEIRATFRSALDRMIEFDDFVFTSACGVYYEWIEKSDPEMFIEIKKRVREGRWEIVGGWFLQPDCNIPSGESFARHALITQRYFLEKFGKTAVTGYNVDSFGHNGNIPQLLIKSGMKNYIFMRPSVTEKELPSELFKWQSRDGSSVTTYRIPIKYAIDCSSFDALYEIENSPLSDSMAFYGVGNHGGGPTIELINKIHDNQKSTWKFSTCEAYFEKVENEAMPTVNDDLQFHAKGCYSAYSPIKMNNRKCENNAIAAEKFNVLANNLCNTKYPSKKLKKAWKNILFNQFHDILGGCCIKSAYDDASYLHGECMSITEQEINNALQAISRRIDTVGNGTPIVVFNSLPWTLKANVQLNLVVDNITDNAGNFIEHQYVRGNFDLGGSRFDTVFNAEIPAYGYRVYRFSVQPYKNDLKLFEESPLTMENEYLKLTFDKNGLIDMTDKKTNTRLLSGPVKAVLMEDINNDTWAHDTKKFDTLAGEFSCSQVRWLERGNVRQSIEVTSKFGSSVIKQKYILSEDSDTVIVQNDIDFQEKYKILKIQFPTAIKEAICEIPFGFIERPTDGSEQVQGQWFVVSGLGVANDGQYSFSADSNSAFLTVLRTAAFADHFGIKDEFSTCMDTGLHSFTFSMFSYKSIGNTVKKAQELNNPPRQILESFHKGELPLMYCGMDVDVENVVITATKEGEDGGTIIRAVEIEDKDTDFTLRFLDKTFSIHINHSEIKTLHIVDDTIRETNLLEL